MSMLPEYNKRLGTEDKSTTGWFYNQTEAGKKKYLYGLKNMLSSKYFGQIGDSFNSVQETYNFKLNNDEQFEIGQVVREFKQQGLLSKTLQDTDKEISPLEMKDRELKSLALLKLTHPLYYENKIKNRAKIQKGQNFLVGNSLDAVDKLVDKEISMWAKQAYNKMNGIQEEVKRDIKNPNYDFGNPASMLKEEDRYNRPNYGIEYNFSPSYDREKYRVKNNSMGSILNNGEQTPDMKDTRIYKLLNLHKINLKEKQKIENEDEEIKKSKADEMRKLLGITK